MNEKSALRKALESYILNNLHADLSDLETWEKDPYLMDPGTAERFWDHVRKAPAVHILGDYDCDGICASYIMCRAVKAICPGKKVSARIPRRFTEGYGMKAVHADEVRRNLPPGSVVITVDNGIGAGDILEGLEKDGYVVLLTDHHQALSGIPKVTMVLDPAVEETADAFRGDYWCGAAVAYKLAEGFVSEDLKELLGDYAALATVADCMLLREGNWGLVRRAILSFRKGRIPKHLSLLGDCIKKDLNFTVEETFSYYLAPVLNAPGRVEDEGGMKALGYLISPRPSFQSAKELADLNLKRRSMRDEELLEAERVIKEEGLAHACPIWIYSPAFEEGIVGIIAGKIAEKYKVPAVVLTDGDRGLLKGSARSAGDFNIIAFLRSLPVTMAALGGHPGAAGLSLTKEQFEEVRTVSAPKSTGQEEGERLFRIEKEEIPEAYEVLRSFMPFGEGNPFPRFAVPVDEEREERLIYKKPLSDGACHLILTGDGGRYKVTSFHHRGPGSGDPKRYLLGGTISTDAFRGEERVTLKADEVLPYDGKESLIDG